MKYFDASDLQERMKKIVNVLCLNHINASRVRCIRSKGSKTRCTLARCHALGKIMQKAMNVEAFYVLEFLERFEKLSEKEKDKVIIHELMHIPQSFGGGFRHHDFVCDKNVDVMYNKFETLKNNGGLNGNLF